MATLKALANGSLANSFRVGFWRVNEIPGVGNPGLKLGNAVGVRSVGQARRVEMGAVASGRELRWVSGSGPQS